MNVQEAKQFIWDLWQPALRESASLKLPKVEAFHREVELHGFKPVGYLQGRDAVFECLFTPLANSLTSVSRQPYVFLGGVWRDEIWVATTGDLYGTLMRPLFGVPSGQNRIRLRFGEFYKIANEKIVELRCLFDILGLAAQLGHFLLPKFQGGMEPPPGPIQNNGIALEKQYETESLQTLKLVEDMLSGCNKLEGSDLASMGMANFWHQDMAWHGPWGIGTARGFEEFQTNCQGPSVESFPNRRGGFHAARIADGVTAAFTGWPSLQGDFTGKPFRGIQPTGGPIGQNLMDFYVRKGNKLHENWVLIDLIDFAEQCGINLLDGLLNS